VSGNFKNIILSIFIAIYLLIAFSDSASNSPKIFRSFSQSHNLLNFEKSTTNDNETAKLPIIIKKPRPKGFNVKILIDLFVPSGELQFIESFDKCHIPITQVFKPQITYVRYLPRDPPQA